MLKIREQILFIRNLAALLRTGLDLDASLLRLQRMMPSRKDELEAMAAEVARGRRLSQVARNILPDEVIAVIVTGEQSGGIVAVLEEIRATLETRVEIQKAMSQLYRPVALLVFGIVVFLGFAVGVIPSMVEATSKMAQGKAVEPNALLVVMMWVSVGISSNWQYLLAGLAVGSVVLAVMMRDESSRATLYGFVLSVPILGKALINMHFSLWARYLAMMVKAGYSDMPRALSITARTVPLALRDGLELFRQDISLGRGLGAASDVDKLPDDDPRQKWPAFLQVALLISEKSGETDSQLLMSSEYMLEDSKIAINRILDATKLIAMLMIALSAGLPIMSYLIEMVTMMVTAMKNI